MIGTSTSHIGQHVLILGLGTSGLAMARWCTREGARVTVADTRAEPPQLSSLRSELPAARFVQGPFSAALIEGGDIKAVYVSPGLTPLECAPVSEAARAIGLPVAGELQLFSQALEDLRASRNYLPKLLAVTGTNGKTTVTSLTAQLVARAGKTVAMAGNVGPTLLDTLTGQLAADALPEVWVLELSSFQLDAACGFEPSVAALLNITQDHLDWHGSMPAYSRAKAAIFGQQALLVLNRDDPVVMQLLSPAGPPQGAKAPSGGSAAHAMASVGARPVKAKLQKPQHRSYVTFGADRPTRPGDFGMEEVNGMHWLVRALEADKSSRKRKDTEEELHIQRLMPSDALRIRGRHNALNALAALALSQAAGCALGPLLYGLREYRGEPHRLESVAIVNEVEYFDDSKGTNVGATVAALSGLGQERRLVAILGGEGKAQDFAPLAQPVARHVRAVVLIGRAAAQIREVLATTGVTLVAADSMQDAVAQASALAQPGDAVLLSPACSSFDMFDNYEHRSRVFVAAVREAANAAGSVLEGVP
ncbi:MAG: UDP-N-acetylmuramoyl-L-alanine--D-glutamate ligase [Comamonadaceae bacterium]|nr:MAG: UDP-N-acetylmuramoyl-L-alanine--D-glutamate ligase [Comamonadaceae bacterium]